MQLPEVFQLLSSVVGNPGFVAVATAAITTVGVKLVESRNAGKKITVDEGTSLRLELRSEIDLLRKQLAQKELDVDKWRERYYELMDKYNAAVNRERIALADLDDAKEELRRMMPPAK